MAAVTVFVIGPALLAGHTGAAVRAAWMLGGGFAFVHLPMQGLINLRFPSGRLAGRRARWLQWAIVVGTGVGLVASALNGAGFEGGLIPASLADLENPLTAGTTVGRVAGGVLVVIPLVILVGLAAGLGVVLRFTRAQGVARQQLKWRATHVVVALALFPLAVTDHLGWYKVDNLLFVLTLVVPVLRYRLWAIDTIISRSVLYASVTAVLATLYGLVTVVGSRLVSPTVGASVAAVVVALAFAPARDRARRVVDRMFYGQRDDPYATLRDLGRRLDHAVAPGQVLPGIVATVTSSLRLPYAAIERADDGTILAAVGRPGSVVARWPLTHEGRTEGTLLASPRRGEDGFDHRDRQLLDDVARHAGLAVHAESLTADLLRSRQRLVTAREEERRRLRRDLHDGLGPILTGIGLNLDAARSQLTRKPEAADHLIADAKTASAQAIADLRQLVYGLRPPALDDLGLVGALQAQADRLGAGPSTSAEAFPGSDRGPGTVVSVTADDLPPLPAAVEVAVYRTVMEAMTNSVRHGQARHCRVSLTIDHEGPTADDQLVVTVTDDGTSAGPWQPGVGLTAMRERAEELGGTLAAGPDADGGATVAARFPLPDGDRT